MTYAWFMVGITFLTQFVVMGFAFYSAGVFLVPLQEQFDVGRFEVSLMSTVMGLGGAVTAPFIGRWVGSGSIRNIMTLGCIAMGIGFLAGSRVTEFWQLFALFGTLIVFAMATMGGVTTQALVVNWFKDNRTMALGVSMVGISASGAVLPAVTTALIESGGWRWAYEAIGWTSLALIPIVYFTVVGRPEERESNQAETPGLQAAAPAAEADFSTRDALRERNLWIISLTCGLSFMVTTAVMVHVVPFATDLGLPATQAAYVITAIAVGAAVAKIAFGWLASKIGELSALQVALAMQAFGTLGLNFVTEIAPIVAIAGVLGTGLGGVMPLAAALLARAFGPSAFGPMMGIMMPIMIPFQSTGAPIAGAIFDQTDNYRIAWFGFTVVMLVAMGILSTLRLPDEAAHELAEATSQRA